ncbi:MAG: hypothetical protein IPO12_13890 [Flavobacteriales bacterium]|nr:hypothetical protein [Flavobacteriales bacterium]
MITALFGSSADGGVTFSTNQGQWPAQVLYRAMVPGEALSWNPIALPSCSPRAELAISMVMLSIRR